MVGFLIAVLSGVLMSVQGIFNTQVTKASSIWSANVFVQATALLSCLAVWLAADRSNLFAVFRSEPKYLLLGGVLGGICNLFLFGVKLFIGMAMKSIAIMSDAFNNLSDMGSCCVAVIGAKLSNRRPDREHPYGHGRLEYISSLIVAFLIMLVGFELSKSSFDKILHPEQISFSLPMMIILALSLLVKLWMYCVYTYIGKKIDSSVMRATARDSINDVISTSAVIVATAVGYFLPFSIDGYIGVIVAVYIMYGGFDLTRETIGLLLGTAHSPELIQQITDEILKADESAVSTTS